MLKTVSSTTNAIGALNFKGTWDANANSPALTSSVGTKGDYYVVGTAGSTNLNGISNWGVGDLATFNGSVWQRVEGGADLNGVNLSVSGTSTLSNLTASTALALNASKEIVSVTNTGTGNNVLATSPTFATETTHSYLTASAAVATDANKKLVSVTNTGTGDNVLATSPSLTTPNIGVASGTSLSVTGALGCDPSLQTGGFNIKASYTFNDNAVNSIGLSGTFNQSHHIIHINTGTGLTSIPVYTNGGSGVAWTYIYLDPDAATWSVSSASPTITFTAAGTGGNTFDLQLNSSNGAATIQRTAGSLTYVVYIQRIAGF